MATTEFKLGWRDAFMSPEDVDAEKARVLLDYQNTENEVNALRLALLRIADAHAKFAELIRHHPEAIMLEGGTYTGRMISGPVSSELIDRISSVEKTVTLSTSLRAAVSKLQTLSENKAALGLR